MDSLPPELLFYIVRYLSIKDQKEFRLTSRHYKDVVDTLFFQCPIFKKKLGIECLQHLPIFCLRNSQIKGDINHIPDSVRVVILDTKHPGLDPRIIRKNPEIQFIISVNYLNQPDFHFSNFHQKNVKLFTTNSCPVRIQTLKKYEDFTFKCLTLSHIETHAQSMFPKYQQKSHDKLLDILYHLKIERLILDSSESGIHPEHLTKFTNIVYISSDIFQKYSVFPLHLYDKLRSLEIINFQYNSRLRLSEFQKIKYSSTFINTRSHSIYFNASKFSEEYHFLKLFKFPRREIVRARHNFSIRIKATPEKWALSLQKQTSHRKHPIS